MGFNAQIDSANQPAPDFQPGEPVVVLYQGLYSGMNGHFAGPAQDPKWAYVREDNGALRAHPIAWMRHPEALAASKA